MNKYKQKCKIEVHFDVTMNDVCKYLKDGGTIHDV